MERSKNKDLPAIRQTVFHVDVSRRYMFDVNQNITIYALKKMLYAATNLEKVYLRLFHEGIEYTDKDTSTLDYLFPDLQRVEFGVRVSYDNIETFDTLIQKLNFDDQYCSMHNGKYRYFYCYQCNESICSECRKNKHEGHNVKEKFDHLQSSRNTVEGIFANLDEELKNSFNFSSVNLENKEIAKNSVRTKFVSLVEMLKKIEFNLIGLIDKFFQEGEIETIGKLKENAEILKKTCIEGLDRLKSGKRIEDIMLDEEIFLIFDKCIDAIKDEKENFIANIHKDPQYTDQLKFIIAEIDKTYNEIYHFLAQYLNTDIYLKIHKIINDFSIKPIDTTSIMDKINSYINKITQTQKSNSKIRKYSNHKAKPQDRSVIYDRVDINTAYPGTNKRTQRNIYKSSQPSYFENKMITHNRVNVNTEYPGTNTQTQHQHNYHESNMPSYYQSGYQDRIITHNIIDESVYPAKQIDFNPLTTIKKRVVLRQEEVILDGNDYICQVIEGTADVISFSKSTNSISRKTVHSSLYPSFVFNYNSAWFNYNNKLYISGGIEKNGEESNVLIEYSPIEHEFRRLSDLPKSRSHHSMYIDNNCIYIIGGTSKDCYKYNLRDYNYEHIGQLNTIRFVPVLFKKGNTIYAFFGTDSSGYYLSNAEIKQDRSPMKWDNLEMKGEKNVKIIGCGIIQSQLNEIMFLGGLSEHGTLLSSVMVYDLEKNTLSKTELLLREGTYFNQSLLTKFDDDFYGNFTLEPNTPFFQIKFG